MNTKHPSFPDVLGLVATALYASRTKALMPGALSYRLPHSSTHSEQHVMTQRPQVSHSLERDTQFLLLLCIFTTTGTVATSSIPAALSCCLLLCLCLRDAKTAHSFNEQTTNELTTYSINMFINSNMIKQHTVTYR